MTTAENEQAKKEPSIPYVDVLIVGAGLSGIAAAYHLQTKTPHKTYAIVEGRHAMGGTWDLFRYPGVRSDSDMFTLGYRFHPWDEGKAIADGASILRYIKETAHAYGIDAHIHFGHRVVHASWSSAEARWTVTLAVHDADTDTVKHAQWHCHFMFMCTGYYDYDQGYTPEWAGMADFTGRIVHPQHWTDDIDYTGKEVVVIGSGATAVTLVPAMSDQARHVTMLQRSPTYIASRPSEDKIANFFRRILPAGAGYFMARWKAILESMLTYYLARWMPEGTKNTILKKIRQELGDAYDVETHFSPRYKPWDERFCLVPDGDLFEAIRRGKVSIVTDHIDHFTAGGIALKSGEHIHADLIVTATGLVMTLMKGIDIVVDGTPIKAGDTLSYKGLMYSNIPNMASAFGYTNASWTLRCELTAEYICRLLNYMDDQGYVQCTPRSDPTMARQPALSFTSGYVQRALDDLPKQGTKQPWKVYQNYIIDLMLLRLGKLDDGVMEFKSAPDVMR